MYKNLKKIKIGVTIYKELKLPKGRFKMGKYYIGLDIGGTKILGALFDEEGKIITREKKKTKASEGAEVILGQICKVIDKLLENIDKKDIIGVGAAAPGIIDSENGIVVFSPNMEWDNYPLKDKLEKIYNIEVFLGNDVNIGTLGEHIYGAGQGIKNLVGIFVGTGIGGGIIIENKVFGGAIGAAGEIGHIVLNPDGPFCGCRARGCLESYGSKTAMQKEIIYQIERGRETVLKEVIANNDSNIIKSESLKIAYEKDDEVTVEVLNNACKYIGAGLATVMNMLNPEMIILGGGVLEAMGDIMIPKIKQSALKHTMPKIYESCKITRAKLGDDSGVYGGMALVKQMHRDRQEMEEISE